MADKEAKIFLGIEGADRAIGNLQLLGGQFGKLANQMLGIVNVAKDFSQAVTNAKPLSLAAATNEAEKYRDVVTRIGVAYKLTGGQLSDLQDYFSRTSMSIGHSADEVASAFEKLAKTSDFRTAKNELADLAVRANNTNRPLPEMVRDYTQLRSALSIPSHMAGPAFRMIDEQAEKSGTQGGGAALERRLEILAPTLKKYDTSTDEKRRQVLAIVAALGKNLPQEQATQVVQDALGSHPDAQQLSRYLGRDILKSGKIDPMALFDLSRKIRQSRDKDSALRTETKLFGGNRQAALNWAELSPDKINELARDSSGEDYASSTKFELGSNEQYRAAAKRYESKESQARDRAEIERQGRQTDLYMQTDAGKLKRANLEKDYIKQSVGTDLLKGTDRYNANYQGQRGLQVGIESMQGVAGDFVRGAAAAKAYVGSRDSNSSDDAMLNELKLSNQQLQNLPQKIGEQLRDDPNQLGVDSARARPAN